MAEKKPGPDPAKEIPEEEIIEVIQELRQDIKSTLEPEEARRLNASLGQHMSRAKKDEYRSQAVQKAVQRIDEYPPIRSRFSDLLERSIPGYHRPSGREHFSVAGDLFDIEPGKLMVCPVDPQHYQRYRRNARQKLTCPHHDVALVPAEQDTA